MGGIICFAFLLEVDHLMHLMLSTCLNSSWWFFVSSCLTGTWRGQKEGGRDNTSDKNCTAKSATLCLFVSGFPSVRNLFLHKKLSMQWLYPVHQRKHLIPMFYNSWRCNIKIQRKLGN